MEIRISKEDFMKIIKRVAKSMLGSVSALNASTIISNNELIYQGTKALIRGNRVHRGVYLDEFYSLLDHETDLRDSIGKMILVDVNSAEISHFDSVFGDLTNWEQVRSKVFCKLINRTGNLKHLQMIPNTRYLDLAVVYSLEFHIRNYIYRIEITNQMMNQMKISLETLHKQALTNMKAKFPYKVETLENLMLNLTGFDQEHIPVGNYINLPVYAMQNRLETDGASVLLDSEPFKNLSDQLGTNLIVFPSSIYEVMALPETPDMSYEDLKLLLMRINLGYLTASEQLSPHIYRYDRTENALEIVD